MNSSCIVLFIKTPIKGRVKTRLADDIGSVHALNIYKCFIDDIINAAAQTGFELKIFFDPPDSKSLIKKWLKQEFDYQVQTGSDLGEKMSAAFQTVFSAKFNRAVLIGSDIPDLPESHIRDAINRLKTHDAVIGPATDGGYYLIGFRSDTFLPDIFKDISWSTDTVYAKTLRNLEKCGLTVHILPQWRDVDTYADLVALADSLSNFKSVAKETNKYFNRFRTSLMPEN